VNGVDWQGALITGVPLLLLALLLWPGLRRNQAREQAKARHPAKGQLSLDEQLEWLRIVEAVEADETAPEPRRERRS
jgi:hypothetical protein